MSKLDELIPLYYEHNKLVKKHKKIADKANKEIKKTMAEQGITEFATNGLVAKVSVSERADLWKMLIEKIKELGLKVLLRLGIYRYGCLETALYNGLINPAMLACPKKKKLLSKDRTRKEGGLM